MDRSVVVILSAIQATDYPIP